MGFLKKLGKFAKKAAGSALKYGISQVPGVGGTVAQVVESKLRSRGANRRKLAVANKSLSESRAKLERRSLASSLVKTASQGTPSVKATDARPAGALAIKAQDPRRLDLNPSSIRAASGLFNASAAGGRAAVKRGRQSKLKRAGEVDKAIRTLSEGQKAVLAEDFKKNGGGSPAAFRQFLADSL